MIEVLLAASLTLWATIGIAIASLFLFLVIIPMESIRIYRAGLGLIARRNNP